MNKKNTTDTKEQEVKDGAVESSTISSENDLYGKREINSTGGRGDDYVNIVNSETSNRTSEEGEEGEEGKEGKDIGKAKIDIEGIGMAEKDIEKNGDEEKKKEKNEGVNEEEVVSDKLKDDKEVIDESSKESGDVSQRKGLIDLMKSKIQPRMKVFTSF